MTDRHDPPQGGPVHTALSTSVRGNATAFGFSIMITITYGAVTTIRGSPSVAELLLYGIAAAAAVGLIEGLVSRGFREHVGAAAPQVQMLGTALNVASVVAATGAGIGVAEAIDGAAAWPAAAFAAASVYVAAESTGILVAEVVQRRRGDPEADEAQE